MHFEFTVNKYVYMYICCDFLCYTNSITTEIHKKVIEYVSLRSKLISLSLNLYIEKIVHVMK